MSIRLGLTTIVVGMMLGGLALADTPPLPPPVVDAADIGDGDGLELTRGGGCRPFSARDALRGRGPRNPSTCRPTGIDAGIVRSPIAKGKKRNRHNYDPRGPRKHRHRGTDFVAPCGTTVRSAHGGKVVVKGRRRHRALVAVTAGPRRLTSWYGPLRQVRVRTGALVRSNRKLGVVGKPHRGRRCQLHFGVALRVGARDPLPVNPSRWLKRRKGTHVSGLAPAERGRGGFIVATLNVLGHSHTARGGDKRGFAGSRRRMGHVVSLLGANGVSVVGLQELQPIQRASFLRRTRGWRIHSPKGDPQDSVAWRSSRFRLLRATSFKVPYFRRMRRMPIVVLKDRATGRKLVVISVHNPANKGSKAKMRKRRAAGVRRELAMVKHMRRTTRAPVILMGDFNDKRRRFFCHMTRQGLKASSRGNPGRRGCRKSEVAGIDWIFSTRGIKFTGHQRVQGGLVARTTDHPLVLARVRR